MHAEATIEACPRCVDRWRHSPFSVPLAVGPANPRPRDPRPPRTRAFSLLQPREKELQLLRLRHADRSNPFAQLHRHVRRRVVGRPGRQAGDRCRALRAWRTIWSAAPTGAPTIEQHAELRGLGLTDREARLRVPVGISLPGQTLFRRRSALVPGKPCAGGVHVERSWVFADLVGGQSTSIQRTVRVERRQIHLD